jgi:hypothetical protein
VVGISLGRGERANRPDGGYHGIHNPVPYRGMFINPLAVRQLHPSAI